MTKTKKLAKWQTDPRWAFRRAKRRQERLPIETEQLLKDDPQLCYSYAVEVLNDKLPQYLEDSVCENFENSVESSKNDPRKKARAEKSVATWIINYNRNVCAPSKIQLSDKLIQLFIKVVKENIESAYDWGQNSILILSRELVNVPKEIEDLMWSNPQAAFKYHSQSSKRIPQEFEYNCLLHLEEEEFVEYVKNIFKGRAPEHLENILLEKPVAACKYAEFVMGGKLPEAIHSSLIMRTFGNQEDYEAEAINNYINFVRKTHFFTKIVLADFDKTATVEEVLKHLQNLDKVCSIG